MLVPVASLRPWQNYTEKQSKKKKMLRMQIVTFRFHNVNVQLAHSILKHLMLFHASTFYAFSTNRPLWSLQSVLVPQDLTLYQHLCLSILAAARPWSLCPMQLAKQQYTEENNRLRATLEEWSHRSAKLEQRLNQAKQKISELTQSEVATPVSTPRNDSWKIWQILTPVLAFNMV